MKLIPPIRPRVPYGKVLIKFLVSDPIEGLFHGIEVGLKILMIMIHQTIEQDGRTQRIFLVLFEALVTGNCLLTTDTMELEIGIRIG
jgi:hypothetical protein